MQSQKISVISVSFNQGKYIADNIRSVLAQQDDNFEHIVIDAGSTDGTLDILRSFEHLDWVSEPDRGQSHGLNKGFAKASGDIIVWLNSDDFLAPNAFELIRKELKHHPVTLAKAVQVNGAGDIEEEIPNPPRGWFDLVKYWIPYAWLAQTSVFFTRELLEQVRYSEGEYLREDLYYAMDLDLWLRFAEVTQFSSYIDQVCSSFRIHEEAKTGSDGEAAQRECSRVFRFHQTRKLCPERRFSIVLELSANVSELEKTLACLAGQYAQGIEVLLCDPHGRYPDRALRKLAGEYDAKLPLISVRSVSESSPNSYVWYNSAARQASGSYLLFLSSGDVIPGNFLAEGANFFEYDWVGFVLPLAGDEKLQSTLTQEGTSGASIVGLMTGELFSPKFLCRKLSFQDLGGFWVGGGPLLAARLLLSRALLCGWHVISQNTLSLEDTMSYAFERETHSKLQAFLSAKMVCELNKEGRSSTFNRFKVQKGLLSTFDQQVVENAQSALKQFEANIRSLGLTDAQMRMLPSYNE